MTWEQAASDEQILQSDGYEVLVVTVLSVDKAEATNEHPATVKVHIDRALRGKMEGEIEAPWGPPPSGVDWSGEGADEERRKWARRELDVPAVGSTWIALVKTTTGYNPLTFSWRYRKPHTEDLEKETRRMAKRP